MLSNGPNPVSGNSAQAGWLRQLLAAVRANKLLPGVGYKLNPSSNGVSLEIQEGRGGGGDSTRFLVISVHGDYMVCHRMNGSTEGSTDINVAKAPNLRHSLESQTVGDITQTYTYGELSTYLGGGRDVYVGATKYQTEVVLPLYQSKTTGSSDAEIWADQPTGGTGTIYADDGVTPLDPQPTWLDSNRDARAWYNIGMNLSLT